MDMPEGSVGYAELGLGGEGTEHRARKGYA